MELVEPIRDKKAVENMKLHLKEHDLRGWLIFIVGINSGLRISDLLTLTVEDVKNRDRITVREQKTDKRKDFPLSESVKKAVDAYLRQTGLKEGYLFPSRKRDKDGRPRPINRITAWAILNRAAEAAGIITKANGVRIGTHSLRKTFGYHAYESGIDITRIMQLLNHSSEKMCLRYIGITKEELDNVYINLNL